MTRLKLDENLSTHLQSALAAMNHDVTTAAQEGLLSRPDTAVAAAAAVEKRMLLTLDVEFADLRKYPPGRHAGLILFRPHSLGPRTVNRLVTEFVQNTTLDALAGCVVVVEPSRVRIRRPPPSTGSPEASHSEDTK